MMEKKLSDLPSRALAHSIGSLIVIFLIFMTSWSSFWPLFTLIVAAIAMVALYEYYGLLRKKALVPAFLLGLVFCFLFIFSVATNTFPEVVLGAALLSFFFFFGFGKKEPLSCIATNFFGLIYIAVPFSLFVKIAFSDDGAGSFWFCFFDFGDKER